MTRAMLMKTPSWPPKSTRNKKIRGQFPRKREACPFSLDMVYYEKSGLPLASAGGAIGSSDPILFRNGGKQP